MIVPAPKFFADTGYWIALLSPADSLHDKAKRVTKQVVKRGGVIVTTSYVLIEVLDGFADTKLRAAAAAFAERIKRRTDLIYIDLGQGHFETARKRYERYRDKMWSLTDCSSMEMMHTYGIAEALTHDNHFMQAGFAALLR